MKVIYSNGNVQNAEGKEELQILRHSAAHLLAQAVKRLYPNAKFGYGPANEKGFYYDIDFGDVKISEDHLPEIEAEMGRIAKENLPVKPFVLTRDEAIGLMTERGEDYKIQHIGDLPVTEEISFYRQGEYIDMCRGPHVTYTKAVKTFKLTGISGAYWKNDSNNKMLTRIYGNAFLSREEMDEWLKMRSEAEKRDHRRIGKEMRLFMFCDEGMGFPFFLPGGLVIKNELIEYWREIHRKNGYREISTPLMLSRSLWETSGHWAHYKDTMYSSEIDGEEYCIKPMNCPGGVLVYQSRPHSYRELPLRVGELGVVHRHELKGTLHGLFRVRCFTQDDAHIFMTEEQIPEEIKGVISLIDEVYGKFGFEYSLELSTRPVDSMGSDEDWERAESGLKEALDSLGLAYEINEGDGAFYGPKIDFHLKDSLGRTWQCGTIQLDFQLPQNFDLSYVSEDGQKRRPIMIHRVCFGSVERFIGILTEHYAGKFPVWLAPVQAKVLVVSKKSGEYAKEIYDLLCDKGIRCEIDDRNEKIGYMIREAQYVERVPYMLVIGEKEAAERTVSVRSRNSGKTEVMTIEDFIGKISEKINNRE
ncbi:MAG: threonine--tRNA ligase [Ruminococcaceae bacterium]|nr:threonine--tRNA ligase [Oscillospiraceae bacterium]